MADRCYIIGNGHIIESTTTQGIRGRAEVMHRHLSA
jgi:hypothetical protein